MLGVSPILTNPDTKSNCYEYLAEVTKYLEKPFPYLEEPTSTAVPATLNNGIQASTSGESLDKVGEDGEDEVPGEEKDGGLEPKGELDSDVFVRKNIWCGVLASKRTTPLRHLSKHTVWQLFSKCIKASTEWCLFYFSSLYPHAFV